MKDYFQTKPPHIRSSDSISKKMQGSLLCLLPIFTASIFFFGWQPVRILMVSWLAAAATQIVSLWSLRKKSKKIRLDLFLTAALFGFLLPPDLPSWMVLLGSFVCCFLAYELFGGIGSSLFHAPAVGYLFLRIGFPSLFDQSIAFVSVEPAAQLEQFLFGHGTAIGEVNAWIVLASGLLFTRQRGIRWVTPFLFLAALTCGSIDRSGMMRAETLSGAGFFAAFFLMAMPGMGPMTKKGYLLFAVLTGVGTALLWKTMPFWAAWSFSVLLMNLWIPWMDEWIRPKLSRLVRGLSS